jgi:NADH-quinone oxidoreductase subunit L
MANPTIILLILLLPLIGGVVSYAVGSKRAGWVHVIASAVVLLLAVLAILGLSDSVLVKISWFQIGWVQFEVGLWYDELSAVMTLVVAIVALMVALFSQEYMNHDEGKSKYFAFLGLFAFSMYGIVLSSNLLMTFVFWELVGFSSYLLIGFWYQKEAPPISSFKAFIMNRIGDAGFLLGLSIIYAFFKTFDIQEVLTQSGEASELGMTPDIIFLMGIGLFLAAVGKSAQFPLQTWLPDAMTGPTPVSALIHAATMVAAGVYLMVRMFPLLSIEVLQVMAVAGGVTAFMGAFAAFAQNDIKKILAYSTVSQLGYMILAVGAGFPMAAFFHLATHAFFKAGLFLCAGSVIHYFHETHHEEGFDGQDIRNMGGLRKALPYTFWAFTICMLSLSGVPLFSGYLSKEMILSGLVTADYIPFSIVLLGFASVFMTAAYMSRLYFQAFFGGKEQKLFQEASVVKISLGILSLLSLGVVFSLNPLNPNATWLSGFLRNVMDIQVMVHHPVLPVISIVLALFGLFVSYLYVDRHLMETPIHIVKKLLYRLSRHHLYLDHFYRLVVARGAMVLAKGLFWFDQKVVDRLIDLLAKTEVVIAHIVGWVDEFVVDGMVNLTARFARFLGNRTRRVQSGNVQYYFVWALIGVLAIFYFMN